jgi:glycerophosphoryl diester phosphodiesterase
MGCRTEAGQESERRAPPRLIAHRGASAIAPENTLPALQKAWEKGADAVEMDVRLSSDDRIVAIHDRTTGRTCDRDLRVPKTSYDSLRELDAGSWFDPAYEGTRIPLLDSLLDRVPFHKELVIEVKSGRKTIDRLERLLADRESIPRFSLISFDRRVLAKGKELFPKIPAYWVLRRITPLERTIRKGKETGVDGLNIHHGSIKGPEKVERLHEAGFFVLCWTVNDSAKARRLLEWGVDGIVTDEVEKLRGVLQEGER